MAWHNRILHVDLNAGVCRERPLNRHWRDAFIGGRGLGSRYLHAFGAQKADPLSPENPLIFATGPLTGTAAATAGRYVVVTKGPLTGAIACSNSGGHFGAALKHAGWDMIVITGQADRPVYLFIDDDHVRLMPAEGFIWGESFWNAEERLKDRHGHDIRVAGIGRAGENGVRFAAIMNDRDRAAGRSGVGAVMGSKRLKAIAVRGRRGVVVHDPARFEAEVMALQDRLARAPGRERLAVHGTNAMMSKTCAFGSLPTRNATRTSFEGCGHISSEAMRMPPAPGRQPNLLRNKACFACTIGCGRISRIQPDHFTAGYGERYLKPQGGLEYESAYGLGAMVGVDDLDACTFANMVCNEEGMDPISFGVTLAAAMEMYERGIIGEKETLGLNLSFGNAETLVEAVRLTARREGFGEHLADGALRLCARYGHEELAMVVKGQEFPGYDPRAMQGMGLAYATSPRGACHLRADPYASDFETADPEVKPPIVKETQDEHAAIDTLGVCLFSTTAWTLEDLARLMDAACEGSWDAERLRQCGERIFTLERLFNLQSGFTAADDCLPQRMLEEPASDGVNAGRVSALKEMLPVYYRLREWDAQGRPKPDLLARLGLDDLDAPAWQDVGAVTAA